MKLLFLIASAHYSLGSASKTITQTSLGKASGGHQSESWTAKASKRSGPSGPRRFVRKPGGRGVELTEKEVVTEAKDRHSSCDFHVLDAKSPDFLEKLHRSSYKPLLILNAVENWNVEDWTKDSWLSMLQKEGVMNTLGDVYPWKMNSKTACCYPHFPDDVREYFSLWNQKNGTRADGTVEFVKDNGVIWDPGFIADDKTFPGTKYPVPEWFPKNARRFLAFHAYGTSNGFHTHPTTQWLTQLRGYKSWYFLPPEIFTYPDDWTSLGPQNDAGFYSEPVLQDTNTVCGYKPQDSLLKRHLQSCTAGPGEIVLVPKRWWHATCSLDEFMVATGGSLVPHIDTPNQAYRTFPEEDRTEDNLAMLQKHFLSFPESRRPDKNTADRMARMLLGSSRVEWPKIVFRIQVDRPNEVDKTAYFYNDHTYPVELYAKPKFKHDPQVHVTSIGPNQVVLVETTTDWMFSAEKMFSAKRADGSGVQEFSVLHGFGRDEHVVFGENSVVSFQGEDELMEQLKAWHSRQ